MEPGRSDHLHYLWWLAVSGAAGLLLYLLSPILAPFLFAAILAYICNPLVERMARRKVPRTLAVALTLLLLAGIFAVLLVILLPLLAKQIQAIAGQVPDYIDWFRSVIQPKLERLTGIELDVDLVKNWLRAHLGEIQDIAFKLLPSIKSGGLAVLGFVVNLVLVPVVLFYFLRDWNRLLKVTEEVVPRRWKAQVRTVLGEIDEVLGQFLRGQLMVMVLMGLFYAVGLWFVGLHYALSVGIIAGLVTFVPYLGVIVGVSLASLTGLLEFQDLTQLISVWGVFVIGNLLEGYVFVPRMVGDRIGLHPVAVIFALLAFGQLFGFFGVLLALPASASLLVWLRHMRSKYLASEVYNA